MTPKYVPSKAAAASGSVQNLLDCYRAASPETKAAGMSWYNDAWDAIVGIHRRNPQTTAKQLAAIAAVLSPGLSWPDNLRALETMLAGRTPQGYSANITKAQRLLAGEDPDTVLGGDKVRAFYLAISDWKTASVPVVDRHMLRAWMGIKARGAYACSPAMTRRAADDISAAAQQAGLPVSQFQAIVWLQVRLPAA